MRKHIRAWGSGLFVAVLAAGFLGGGTAFAVGGGTEVADGALPFVAKVDFGGVNSCTGALIDPNWIVTAKDCFTDGTTTVTAGVPARSTTVVIGRADTTTTAGHRLVVTSIVPHPDRNLVLAELSAPVKDITPIKLASTGPQQDESLQVAGYGRTANEWLPARVHEATFGVSAVTAASFEVVGAAAGATICKGDAGGPAFRSDANGVELVGINDTSWQHGCLGETETRDGAFETRVDDLGSWITQSIAVQPSDLKEPVIGEFTGDSFQDLIGIDSLGNGWLFPGTSATTWGRPQRLSSTWGAYRELTVGRVNRDNYDDLVVITGSGTLLVYYGAAGGGFSGTATLATGWTDYRDLTIGKINNTAYANLYAIKNSTGQWYQFTGVAAGGFTFTTPVLTGAGWGCCRQNTIGYFTNDSYLDVATIDTSNGELRVYPGQANGTLGAGVDDATAGTAWNGSSYLAAGTFDSTGLTGLLEVESSTGKLYEHPRTAGGGWGARVPLPGRAWGVVPGDMVQIVSGEFNRDGHPDLIGIDASGSGWLFPSTSASTWGFPSHLSTTWGSFRDLVVGRVNRDDYDDLIAVNASGNLVVYDGVAAGGITAAGSLNTGFADYRDLALGKKNGTAYQNLYAIKNSTGQWYQFTGLAAGSFNFTTPVLTGAGWGCCQQNTFAQIDQDGYLDLATVETATGKLRIYPGQANGAIGAGAVDPAAGANWLNKDLAAMHDEVTGRDDLIAATSPYGPLQVFQSDPNGDIKWSDPISYGSRY